MRNRDGHRDLLPPIISFGALLILWKVLSLVIGPTRIAPPEEVAGYFLEYLLGSRMLAGLGLGKTGSILPHLLSTLGRYFVGAAIGISCGILLGLAMARSRRLRGFVEPPLQVIRFVPPLAVVPFFVMWIGPRPLAQILMVVYYVSLVLSVYTLNAVNNIHPNFLNLARTLGANEKQIFRTVIAPAIVPELIGGVRVALVFSWGLEIVSELVGTSKGLGLVIISLIPFLLSGGIMAIVLLIVLIALAIDNAFVRITRQITRWMPEQY